jgi:hypothetical protein
MSQSLINAATQWVVEKYPYNPHHLLQSLVWLDRLAPNSRDAVRLATLTHDMERAFPGPDQPPMGLTPEYYQAHSARSARIVGAWLREQGADEGLVKDIEALVNVHEFGGWPEANLVQAADSLSFLEVNVDLFLGFARAGTFTLPDVRHKFEWMHDRIQTEAARTLATPLRDAALTRLDALAAEMTAVAGGVTA